ncbi:MAG: lytic transglycosylase domain-containing protein [Spirochaetales bacterium]|nr:lytic transglycosylase domain-containing protein [Spirochaetales bacterium]
MRYLPDFFYCEAVIKQIQKILFFSITIILICWFVATSCTGYPWNEFNSQEDGLNNSKVETEVSIKKNLNQSDSVQYSSSNEQNSRIVLAEYLEDEPDYGLALYRFPEFRENVVAFYSEETGSESIALLILQAAEAHDIPLSLAFSLAWVESRYNPQAVNYNSSSIDRGLFQLNSRSFPGLTEDEFFDPAVNSGFGMDYLRQCLEAGDTEIVALAMYNAGRARVSGRGTPLMTLEYISKILEYQEGLEERFSDHLIKGRGQKVAFKSPLNTVPVDRNKGIK